MLSNIFISPTSVAKAGTWTLSPWSRTACILSRSKIGCGRSSTACFFKMCDKYVMARLIVPVSTAITKSVKGRTRLYYSHAQMTLAQLSRKGAMPCQEETIRKELADLPRATWAKLTVTTLPPSVRCRSFRLVRCPCPRQILLVSRFWGFATQSVARTER